MEQIEKNKEDFIKIYTENIKRDGADAFLDWIQKSDFFTAPASTKYHGNYEGGLCEHVLNVYQALTDIVEKYKGIFEISPETVAITSLLHDVCKIQFYKKGFRNVKNDDTGKWERVDCFTIEDQVPLGHGEKSAILIQSKMKLTLEELVAIRWHMSGWDNATRGGEYAISTASEKFPLVTMLQIADMESTYLLESKTE